MSLYILNISVDTTDPNPGFIPEDLSINDQESIVEIVVEKVLGYENAIKEYDDHDTEDHNTPTTIKLNLIVRFDEDAILNASSIETTKHPFPELTSHLASGFYQLDPHPPKV